MIQTRCFVALQNMLDLSDEQIQDLMFIRQVDYAKHHVLSSQREAVAANIHQECPTPIVNFNKLSASAIQLQQQALDEHDVVHRVTWAVLCGVCCASPFGSLGQPLCFLSLCASILVISHRLASVVNLLVVIGCTICCVCMTVASKQSRSSQASSLPGRIP